MCVLLPALMCYQLTGEAVHEVGGCAMFLLFLAHNALNVGWYRALRRGAWTPLRFCQTLINFGIFALMIAQMVSGIIISDHLFVFMNLRSGIAQARAVHLVCGWWSFVLMAVHAGMHFGFIASMFQRGALPLSAGSVPFVKTLAALGAVYGAYAFYHAKGFSYMLALNQFAFMELERSALSVTAEYFSMMLFWMFMGALWLRLMRRLSFTAKEADADTPVKD